MEDLPGTRPRLGERLQVSWKAARAGLLFAVGILGTLAALSLPVEGGTGIPGLQADAVASQDVQAPYTVSYTSEVLTEHARQQAADSVAHVFDTPDTGVARTQVEALRQTLASIEDSRSDTSMTQNQKLQALLGLTEAQPSAEIAERILGLSASRWEAVSQEAESVLEQVMRREIREGSLENAQRSLPTLVSISLPDSQAEIVVFLARAYLTPNSRYNEVATEAARESARRAVAPVVKSYAAGETVVSRGEIVTPLHIEALRAFGVLDPALPVSEIAVRGLFTTLLACALTLYVSRAHAEAFQKGALGWVVVAGFVGVALAMQLMIPGHAVLPYVFPAATLPMLLGVLLGPGMGVASALALGALAGFLGGRGLELALYFMLAGAVGSLVIGRAERLSVFFWAGLAADLAGVAVLVVFRLPDPAMDVIGKGFLLLAATVSGLFSASLCFVLLLLVGNFLGIPTSLQLIELSRPDHPLLQFILRNAPGTYQHSLQVANLAEQAARSIGANPLLTRVGALYHDSGKALRPQFFIENQVAGQNVHEQLDPATSASVILSHVPDGLELARKHRLPGQVRAFIPEHHGTMDVSFQYQAAVESAGGSSERVDRRDYTYPGPRPRSRETALLMLADGVEAKARAEMPTDEDAIDQVVHWVIDDRLAKGQLDQTELTLRDLETIRRSFVATLRGLYHPRLKYPSPMDVPEPPVAAASAAPLPIEKG
ncbi:MAG: HDIG domain-containing metalloprotein [Anaerolineales bacterium]